MIDFDVRAENVRELVAKLKTIDPQLVKDFRKELRGVASKVASNIQAGIQVIPPPLSNMQYGSERALGWAGAKATVSISLAGSRRRDITPLLGIKVDSPRGMPGYIVAEKSGSLGPSGSSPQGTYLIAAMTDKFGPLKGKGGNRIAWRFFWRKRKDLNVAAMAVIKSFEDKVSREIA